MITYVSLLEVTLNIKDGENGENRLVTEVGVGSSFIRASVYVTIASPWHLVTCATYIQCHSLLFSVLLGAIVSNGN